MRKIIVELLDTGAVTSVDFIGGHVTNRELERILRAIKQYRKQKIRDYRKQQIVEKIVKEQKDGTRSEEQSKPAATATGTN
jgi:hypothetical protein